MKKRLAGLLALALLGCGSSNSSQGGFPGNNTVQLNVLHYNDSNSALISEDDFGGVARFATVLQREQARGPSLTLSAGDNLGAGAQFQASRENGVPYFEATAMRLLGVQASAVGPGEFYYGPETFGEFLSGVNVPFVSANLDVSAEPSLSPVVKSSVLRVQGVPVSVIGVTTPRLAFTSTPGDVVVSDQLAALTQAEIDRAGPLVVVLANFSDLASARVFARQLRGVDLLVSASTNEVLANPGQTLVPGDQAVAPYPVWEGNVPIVFTGPNFHYLGRLSLMVDEQGVVRAAEGGPLRVAGGVEVDAVTPDPVLLQQVEVPLRQLLAQAATQVVGSTEVPLDGEDADVVTRETNLGDFLADSMLSEGARLAGSHHVAPPVVALLNGGAINSHATLPVGNLTRLDFQQMLPFASFLVVVPNIPASQFKELVENSVSRVEHLEGRFAQVAGFRFSWDPNALPGSRVRTLTLDGGVVLVAGGSVVLGAPAVSVATLDFTARGGDEYPFGGAPFTGLGQDYQQTARQFLQNVLSGQIRAVDYPVGGKGRIVRL